MTIYQLFQGLGALKAVMIRLQGSVNHLIPQLEEKERRHNMGGYQDHCIQRFCQLFLLSEEALS